MAGILVITYIEDGASEVRQNERNQYITTGSVVVGDNDLDSLSIENEDVVKWAVQTLADIKAKARA